MWAIRVMLLVLLGAYVGLAAFLLRRRKQYSRFVENRTINVALVAIALTLTWVLVLLPPAAGYRARPDWLRPKTVAVGFAATGALLVGAGFTLSLWALRQRRAVGLQDSPNGLITSNAYRYFRHPIYTGILGTALGLALLMRNPDGLAVFPLILLAYLTIVLLEERHDLGVTFAGQYEAYRQTTRMFGPVWLWSGILVAILLIALSAWIWP